MNSYRRRAAALAIALFLPLHAHAQATPAPDLARWLDVQNATLAFKSIYASAIPATGVEAQYGSLVVIYSISPEFLASAFITRSVGNDIPLPQRTLSNVVFTYNVIPALKRTGLF